MHFEYGHLTYEFNLKSENEDDFQIKLGELLNVPESLVDKVKI